jgi:hypothetical protein
MHEAVNRAPAEFFATVSPDEVEKRLAVFDAKIQEREVELQRRAAQAEADSAAAGLAAIEKNAEALR